MDSSIAFLASQNCADLVPLLSQNAAEKVVPLLPKVVPLVRLAISSQKDDIFLAGLDAIEYVLVLAVHISLLT
jgi:Parkin co-regulated protein